MDDEETVDFGITWPPVYDDGDELVPLALVGTPAPVVNSEGVLSALCGLCGRRFEGTDAGAVAALLGVHRCAPVQPAFPWSADSRPGEAREAGGG